MSREMWLARSGRVARQTLSSVLDGMLGLVWFTWVVTMLTLSAGLVITLLGIPLVAVTVASGRVIGVIERWRARVLLDVEVPAPAPLAIPEGAGPRLRAALGALGDVPGWKGLAYGVVMLPWGLVALSVTVTVWSLGLALFTAPLWEWVVPGGEIAFGSSTVTGWGRVGILAGGVLVGAGVLIVAPLIVGMLSQVHVALVRALLSSDRRAALEQRVGELQASRSASVDAAEAERRRIERDLHDGTQQRLVGLAIDLGIARERMAGSSDDRARELVERVHEGLKEAIAELRDLVRGIHPAVLADRGLDAAVSALVARSPIPVEVRSSLQRRLPAPVESAAYFVVAEALTNAMKHSDATLVIVTIRDDGEMLTVDVTDEGRGGAHVGPAGGLHGLGDRVRSLDGRLDVVSPPGGPTSVHAVIPCGS